MLIEDNDDFDPKLLDDFEQGAYLWSGNPNARITTPTVKVGDALERPGQDPVENVMQVSEGGTVKVLGGKCKPGKKPDKGVIPVQLLSTADFDATAGGPHHRPLRRSKRDAHEEGRDSEAPRGGCQRRRAARTSSSTSVPVRPDSSARAPERSRWVESLGHDFPSARTGPGPRASTSGSRAPEAERTVTVTLKDNRAPDPGPIRLEDGVERRVQRRRGHPAEPGELGLRDR